LSSEKPIFFNVKIPHTDPKTPFINFITNSQISTSGGSEIPEKTRLVLFLNKAIFLKCEFAKKSLRIIESCHKEYFRLIDNTRVNLRPMRFFPALREIDSLIFELSSILDFFGREINILYTLGIDLRKVDFSNVTKKCQKKLPNEPITKALVKFEKTDSYHYFKEMRNRITHRLPFVTRGVASLTGHRFFFPDDPENDDINPKTENEIDVLTTCKNWVYEILEFVDQTSIIAFKKSPVITQMKAVDTMTGDEIDIAKHFGKSRTSKK
jgi:hypothetical protein